MIKKSDGSIICDRYRLCKSLWSQARGLMFRKQENLVFEFGSKRRIHLHMMFVFYPIDLVFLDEELNVIELKRDFKPFRWYSSKHESNYLLELEHGLIEKKKIKVGDQLILE